MWQGKPVAKWTLEKKNRFFWYLIYPNEPYIETDFYTGNGFIRIKSFMEQSLPVVWEMFSG